MASVLNAACEAASAIRLASAECAAAASLIPTRPEKGGQWLFAVPGEDGCYLRIKEDGAVDFKGKGGPWCKFKAIDRPDGTVVLLSKQSEKYLALRGSELCSHQDGQPLKVVIADEAPNGVPQAISKKSHGDGATAEFDPNALSAEEVASFKEKGFLILKQGADPLYVAKALRTINISLGNPEAWGDDLCKDGAHKSGLKNNAGVGSDLFNKSQRLWSALNILLGQGSVQPWTGRGIQLALKFPEEEADDPEKPNGEKFNMNYHIDGMEQQLEKRPAFSILVGIALSDQLQDNCGNLHVAPGSHLNLELSDWYFNYQSDACDAPGARKKPRLGTLDPVLVHKGDCILVHPLLAHRVGKNRSENIRYQVYYRVIGKNHNGARYENGTKPWNEYAV